MKSHIIDHIVHGLTYDAETHKIDEISLLTRATIVTVGTNHKVTVFTNNTSSDGRRVLSVVGTTTNGQVDNVAVFMSGTVDGSSLI
jgi:hypothetical protein